MRQFYGRAISSIVLVLVCALVLGNERVSAAPAEAGTAALHLDHNTRFRLWLRAESVLTLRRLLDVAGVATVPNTVGERYDIQLLESVRTFQRREKIDDTGIARAQTIERLNRIAKQASLKAAAPASAAPTAPAKLPSVDKMPSADKAPSTEKATSADKAPSAAKPAVQPKAPDKKGAKQAISCESHVAAKTAPAELPLIDKESVVRQRQTIARYEAVAAAGGFATVSPPPKSGYCLGQDDPAVATVAARLIADGYLPESSRGTTAYGPAIVDAVARFQDAQGLVPSGRIGSDTLVALNVPVAERLAALRASLVRLEKILARRELTAGQMHVVVNVPSASVQVLDGTDLLGGYRAIVGRDERESPEFITTIPDIQLAPAWHIPRNILIRDIVPNMQADAGYLEKNQMRTLRAGKPIKPAAVNWRKGPFPDVEQRPGRTNALGPIRFGVGNHGHYYLHGTANPALLERGLGKRFLSSGCVRLADPAQLAALILRGTPDADGSAWTAEKLRARIDAHDGGWEPGQKIRLTKPLPLIMTYVTGWVTRDGRVHFRPDRYERQVEEAAQTGRSPLDRQKQVSQPVGART